MRLGLYADMEEHIRARNLSQQEEPEGKIKGFLLGAARWVANTWFGPIRLTLPSLVQTSHSPQLAPLWATRSWSWVEPRRTVDKLEQASFPAGGELTASG